MVVRLLAAKSRITTRTISGVTYTLAYDAENRMVSFSGGGITASFVYNGDGERVKGTVNGVTTTYIGNYLEYTGSTFSRYIYAGSQRIAMYQGATLYYLASDHLGSTSVTYNTSGGLVAAKRYMPWGEERYSSGSMPTMYRYTGQYSEPSLGLYFYNARWYDSALGRFVSPDSIVPVQAQGVQAWDRFAYVNNSPVMHNDPTGHCPWCIVTAIAGAVAGVGLYTANVLRNEGNLDNWDPADAAVAGGVGLVAGALIGTGVFAAPAIAAITASATTTVGAGAAVATTITSAGVGMAAGGTGYVASNLLFNNEWDSSDFAIASGVGAATGGLGPHIATTTGGAVFLGAGSNISQYSLTKVAHGEEITPFGVFASGVTGALGARIAGPYYNPAKGFYSSDYFDIPSHMSSLTNVLGQQYIGSSLRVFGGSTIANVPSETK